MLQLLQFLIVIFMTRKIQIENNLLRIARILGIGNKDILNSFNSRTEQPSFSVGPSWYPGAKYGTISINDF